MSLRSQADEMHMARSTLQQPSLGLAPQATCAIDHIVKEFEKSSFFSSVEHSVSFSSKRHILRLHCPKTFGLLRQVKSAISYAIDMSKSEEENLLGREPKRFSITKRFFDDLGTITHLIERNKNVHEFDVAMSIDSDRISRHLRARHSTQKLKLDLNTIGDRIREYLHDFQPAARLSRRNLDPFSHEFIERMFDVWAAFRHYANPRYLPRQDYRPFTQFLAAAWNDAGLPLTDRRGNPREPLEAWFADRVRKQFKGRNLPLDGFEANSVERIKREG